MENARQLPAGWTDKHEQGYQQACADLGKLSTGTTFYCMSRDSYAAFTAVAAHVKAEAAALPPTYSVEAEAGDEP